jgi:hypothetical protein
MQILDMIEGIVLTRAGKQQMFRLISGRSSLNPFLNPDLKKSLNKK